MAMKAYASPDEYLSDLAGWQEVLVRKLRAIARAAPVDEQIKWGHLVYIHEGPCFLIRADDDRVMFGFWRGQRLRDIESRLKPGGKYEMARIDLREGEDIDEKIAQKLVLAAVRLNDELGNPTKL